jgi:hypothetical protein
MKQIREAIAQQSFNSIKLYPSDQRLPISSEHARECSRVTVALESRREGKGKAASAIQWTKNNFEHG